MPTRHLLLSWLLALYALTIAVHVCAHPSRTTNPPPHLSKRMWGWPFRSPEGRNPADLFNQAVPVPRDNGVAAEPNHQAAAEAIRRATDALRAAARARQDAVEASWNDYPHSRLRLDRQGRRPYEKVHSIRLDPSERRATNLQRQATPDHILRDANRKLNYGMDIPFSFQEGVANLIDLMMRAQHPAFAPDPVWLRKWIGQVARVVPDTVHDASALLYDAVVQRYDEEVSIAARAVDDMLASLHGRAQEDGLSFELPPNQLTLRLKQANPRQLWGYKNDLYRLEKNIGALGNTAENLDAGAGGLLRLAGPLDPDQSSSNPTVVDGKKLSPWGFSLVLQAVDAQQRFAKYVQGVYDERARLLPPSSARTAIRRIKPPTLPWEEKRHTHDSANLSKFSKRLRGFGSPESPEWLAHDGATQSLVAWAFKHLDETTYTSEFLPELSWVKGEKNGKASIDDLMELYNKYLHAPRFATSSETAHHYRGGPWS